MLSKYYIKEEDIIIASYLHEPDTDEVDCFAVEERKCRKERGHSINLKHAAKHSMVVTEMLYDREIADGSSAELPMPMSEAMPIPVAPPDELYVVNINDLKSAGVPQYIIDMICKNNQKLSRIRITKHCKVVLTDYELEVKLMPLDKALYLLFLRHPEGIRFKELADHRDELMDIYASISPLDSLEKIEASIDSICDPMNNSVNEKCSRIKRAFNKAFSPLLAKNYYIDGKAGEPKTILLDRSLVTWETLRQ